MSDFQSTKKPAYTGIENLEIMKEARNYNNFIIKIIRKYAPKNLMRIFTISGQELANFR